MFVFRKDRSMQMLIIAGLTIVTGVVVMIVSRQTWNSVASMSMEKNKQVGEMFRNKHERLLDRIDQQSEASFPASDSPSWSGSIAGGSH